MSKEKLLINDSKSNNGEVMRNKQIEEMACEMCGNEKICGGVGVEKCVIYPDYRRKANRLYNAGYRKQSEGEWISVGERLPDAELKRAKAIEPDVLFPCLVVRAGNVVSYIDKAWYWGTKFITQDCTDITDSVAHWMPLPELPKMKGGAE